MKNQHFSDEPTREARARASRVWMQIVEIYGHLLISNFGERPPKVWVRALSKLSDDEIQKALTACLKRDDKYPPNLSEFLSIVRDVKRYASHALQPPRLSRIKNDKAFVKAELKKMREILAK